MAQSLSQAMEQITIDDTGRNTTADEERTTPAAEEEFTPAVKEEFTTAADDGTTLVLYAAANFVAGQGAGFGIVQRVEARHVDPLKHQRQSLPQTIRREGLKRDSLLSHKITSPEGADTYALLHALRLAKSTTEDSMIHDEDKPVRRVIIYSESEKIVEFVMDLIRNGATAGEVTGVRNKGELHYLKSVIRVARRLAKWNIEVTLTYLPKKSKEKDGDMEKARVIARQKGIRAIRSRRRTARQASKKSAI